MRAPAKQDDYVRYTIRVPETLYRAVKEAAGDKSVNAEIIARLSGDHRTLRDWFAGQALAGMFHHDGWINTIDGDEVEAARRAFAIADAMLKAREAQP